MLSAKLTKLKTINKYTLVDLMNIIMGMAKKTTIQIYRLYEDAVCQIRFGRRKKKHFVIKPNVYNKPKHYIRAHVC